MTLTFQFLNVPTKRCISTLSPLLSLSDLLQPLFPGENAVDQLVEIIKVIP